jgi:hypothetical protein
LETEMKKAVAILSIFLCAQLVVAQDHTSSDSPAWQQSGASAPAPTSQLQGGSLIYAELSKSIDSKKAKVGDPVVAKVTQAVLSHGKIVIPKNTKIIGHLTAAKARSKEQPQAQLGIVFDRAELKDGSQVPLGSVTIQALASAFFLDQPSSTAANGTGGSADISGMPNSRSGANMGGIGSPPMAGSPYPSNTGSSSADPTSGTGTGAPNTGGQLNAGSRGVSGMPGVRLEPQPQGGMVSVEGKNLKLDSGTQLVLRTQ